MKYLPFLLQIAAILTFLGLSSCAKNNHSNIDEDQSKRVKIIDQVRSVKLGESWDDTVKKFDSNDVIVDVERGIITEKITNPPASPIGFTNFEIRFKDSRVYYARILALNSNEIVWSIGDGKVYLDLTQE